MARRSPEPLGAAFLLVGAAALLTVAWVVGLTVLVVRLISAVF
jgi:hypothetical protein